MVDARKFSKLLLSSTRPTLTNDNISHLLKINWSTNFPCTGSVAEQSGVMEQNFEGIFEPDSIKKYKAGTLQVGPLFLQIHTNLNPPKVFTISR